MVYVIEITFNIQRNSIAIASINNFLKCVACKMNVTFTALVFLAYRQFSISDNFVYKSFFFELLLVFKRQ